MRSDWVAASVRARSMAQRRAGAGTCRSIAAAPGLQAALDQLADTVYGKELATARTLAEAHRATRRTLLWQLRVLAGWLPAAGTRLLRAAAAAFEVDNILELDRQLRRTGTEPATAHDPGPAAFELGGLATAWPRLRTAATAEELQAALASSPWGDPGPESQRSDVLTVLWLRRLTAEAAAVRPWAAAAAALICARLVLVDRTDPSSRLAALVRPLLGTGWTGTGWTSTATGGVTGTGTGIGAVTGTGTVAGTGGATGISTGTVTGASGPETRTSIPASGPLTSAARTPETLRSMLPPAAAQALEGVDRTTDLWRAEAALAVRIETDGFALLRAGLPGPDVVLGAMAVLATDAWRVRAALAAAAVNAGTSEVLDAVA